MLFSKIDVRIVGLDALRFGMLVPGLAEWKLAGAWGCEPSESYLNRSARAPEPTEDLQDLENTPVDELLPVWTQQGLTTWSLIEAPITVTHPRKPASR
jgi:hypothetical protein